MESENKRATKGTEHTLSNVNQKIGGEFVKTPNAPFIEERAKQWDIYYKAQEEKLKTLPKEKITITMKDGKQIEGMSNETSPYEIGKKHLKQSLMKEVLVAKVCYSKRLVAHKIVSTEEEEQTKKEEGEKWELWDLNRPLEGDCKLEFLTFEDKEGQSVFWHSSAHILGAAMEIAFGCQLCIGPALEEGFYYDAYMGKHVVEQNSDYKPIEDAVKTICHGNHPYQRLTLTKKEALELFKANPFKVQLISSKIPEDGMTTAYRCGNFVDLCLGPHIMNTNLVKAFKLTKNSSTNWLGKVTNDSLQRVYGISFPSDKLLKEWIKRKEEEEKRDHRNIGKQQGLFMFHNLSPGSCFFYGTGAHVYNKLVDFMRRELFIRGYQEVISPNIFNLKLWKTSGHYKNYKENLFLMKVDNQGFGLKPIRRVSCQRTACFRLKFFPCIANCITVMGRALFSRAGYCLQIGIVCPPNSSRIFRFAAGAGKIGCLDQFAFVGQHPSRGIQHSSSHLFQILSRSAFVKIRFLRHESLTAVWIRANTAIAVFSAGLQSLYGVGSGSHRLGFQGLRLKIRRHFTKNHTCYVFLNVHGCVLPIRKPDRNRHVGLSLPAGRCGIFNNLQFPYLPFQHHRGNIQDQVWEYCPHENRGT